MEIKKYKTRTAFQGVYNIVCFNWPFFGVATLLTFVVGWISLFVSAPWSILLQLGIVLGLFSTAVSLVVSYYIYDYSNLYDLPFLPASTSIPSAEIWWNIHAGFDEISADLEQTYPQVTLRIFDFYNPKKHTEASIKRARAAYPPHPATLSLDTEQPLDSQECPKRILLFLAAHEIRDPDERIAFLSALRTVLADDGELIITEHLRDRNNFLAYNLGAFHFHSLSTWLHDFKAAGFPPPKQQHPNPFMRTFILHKAP